MMGVRFQPKNRMNLPNSPLEMLGVPTGAPQFESIRGPGGRLRSEFQMTAEPDLAGGFADRVRGPGDIQRLRERATAQGPSQAAQYLTGQQRLMQQQQEQAARQQAAGGQAGAWSRLAMRGGLGGGARERLAGQAMAGQQQALQNIGMGGAQQRLGLLAQDEQQKLALQQALPGLQLGQEQAILGAQQADVARREGARQQNITAMLGDVGRKADFEQERFKTQMQALAAERQARAEESGKK